jgi:hypothetical protein
MPTTERLKPTPEAEAKAAKLLQEAAKIKAIRWPWTITKLSITALDTCITVGFYFVPDVQTRSVAAGKAARCEVVIREDSWQRRTIREVLEFAADSLLHVLCGELRRGGHRELAERHLPKTGDKLITWQDGTA